MKDSIIFYSIATIIFVIYFIVYRYLWLTFIPDNTLTELLALFFVFIILIPLALVSTQKLIVAIKNDSK